MDDYLKEALEIVKAQASVRTMTEEEITSMVQKLATGIKSIAEGCNVEADDSFAVDPLKAIREKIHSLLHLRKIIQGTHQKTPCEP